MSPRAGSSPRSSTANPAAFNLLRYFTGASLLIIVGAALCSGAAVTWLVHAAFMQMERDEADSLAENVAVLLTEEGFGSEQWAPAEVPDPVRRRVRARLDNFGVREFTILGLDGLILEDFGRDRGTDRAVWSRGLEEALAGRATTRWEAPRAWFLLLFVKDPPGDLETYSPVRRDGTIVAVARVRRDLTPVLAQAHAMGPRLMVLAASVGFVTFGLLWLLVRHADRELKRQDRLVEMVQDQLEVSNQLLEQVNRRKDEFYAMCGSDLRAPLQEARSGCRALLVDGPDGLQTAQKIVVRECLRNTEAALDLIDNLLDLARIEAGESDVQLERVDVVSTLEAVVAVQRSLAVGLNTRVETQFPPDPVSALCNHSKLARALSELVSSSIRRAAGSGVILKVEPHAGTVRIVLIERGLTGTVNAPDALASVRELLQSQGATIDVASTGQQNVFTVCLAA